jgi:hypothetical protein
MDEEGVDEGGCMAKVKCGKVKKNKETYPRKSDKIIK